MNHASYVMGAPSRPWLRRVGSLVESPSFVTAMGFGMSAMVAGFLAVNSAEYGPWVPWSLTLHTLMPRGTAVVNPMTYSAVAALVVGLAGAWHFTRRETS